MSWAMKQALNKANERVADLRTTTRKHLTEIDILKTAIRTSETYNDGYCIVCQSHTNEHEQDCPMSHGDNDTRLERIIGGSYNWKNEVWCELKEKDLILMERTTP